MICSFAVGCNHAYVYVRGEYFPSIKTLNTAVDELYKVGFLGSKLMGSKFNLDITYNCLTSCFIFQRHWTRLG